MKKNHLRIKHIQKNINSKSKKALGMIFRIFNRYDNKSYIDAATDSKVAIKEIIDKLTNNMFNNVEMQKAWKIKPFSFEAEDLQCYYNIDEIVVLINNWKNFFGGENQSLIYNKGQYVIPDKKIDIDINTLLDENRQYAYYSSKLLDMNKKLKEQINVLSQNLARLKIYDINDLSNINQVVLQQIEKSPMQTLQMLTSLLSIASAECNKQYLLEQEKDDNVLIQKIQNIIININKEIEQLSIYDTNEKLIKNKDIIKEKIDKISQLLTDSQKELNINTTNKQIDILKESLNTLYNDFEKIKENMLTYINNFEKAQKIDITKLSTDELIDLKLKRVSPVHTKSTRKKQTSDGFIFFDGSKPIQDWLRESLIWLNNNNAKLFAQELKHEVTKLMIKKKASKALQCLQELAAGKTYDELVKQFNYSSRINISRNIDSTQNSAPAIYLSFGYGSKTANGKEKRVMEVLRDRGITDTPINF